MNTPLDIEPKHWTRRRWLAASGGILSALSTLGGRRASAETAPSKPAGDKPGAINVAVVLAPHNTLIDFAGPWEVLSSAVYQCPGFNVYSVAESRAPVLCDDGRGDASMASMGIKSISGLTAVPDFTFEDAPQPRIIIVGGQVGGDVARKYAWIRRAAERAELTASVCTGAFELGKAGVLDGRSATTNRNAYDDFEKTFPKVKLVRGVRFVESGPVATATGLTAGIDLALRITERFYGRSVAQRLAEYEEWPSKAWIV
jgi:transcriptional regulator GlxA family with amidase domain